MTGIRFSHRLTAAPAKAAGMSRCRRGFTLVELVVTVAVVAILAAIALPSYASYIRKGKRSTAQAALVAIAGRQQAYLLDSRAYTDSLSALNFSVPQEIRDDYAFTVVVDNAATPRTFLATATPVNSQARAAEQPLTISQSGARTPAGVRGYWGQ